MAKMGIGSKISVILVLIIFVNCSIIAQEDEKQWEDPINLQNNPSEALLTQTGWKTLQENPSLMKESNVADAAFQHSATEAAKIVNKNIDLLSSGNFRTKFKEAIINNQGQDGKPTILNDNPAAKKEFFKKEYDIGMVDEKLEILKFDGRILTTGGTGSSSLAPPDEFSKAVIQKEGSIEFEKNSFSGTTLSREGETIKVSKGFVTLRTDNKITIEAEDVLDFTVTKENKEITYSGTFTFKKTDEENIVNGKFFRFFGKYREYKVQIDGKISDPKNTKPGEYFLVGHVTLKYNEGKNGVIEVKGNVLYTEEIGRRTASICNNYVGSSCIVNPNAYNNLKNSISSVRFLNIQGGDKISFKTPQYISSVEFNNVLDGEVTFTSQNGGKQTLVKVGPNSKTDVQGDLNNMNIGRLDVIYETDAEPNVKYVKHWHSNENLPDSVKNYFADARANPKANSLVECKIGVDCMKNIVGTFGKKVPPTSTKPDTILFVAGNDAEMARSMEQNCRSKSGCWIVDGRGSFFEIDEGSSIKYIGIGGHHVQQEYEESEFVYNTDDQKNPQDELYISSPEDASPAMSIPKAPEGQIEVVAFSACNTNNREKTTFSPDKGYLITYPNPLINAIEKKYGPLVSLIGYYNKAPVNDVSYKNGIPTTLPEFDRGREIADAYRTPNSKIGSWAISFVGNDNKRYWTNNGERCFGENQRYIDCTKVTKVVTGAGIS